MSFSCYPCLIDYIDNNESNNSNNNNDEDISIKDDDTGNNEMIKNYYTDKQT